MKEWGNEEICRQFVRFDDVLKIFKFGFFTLSGQKSLAKQKKLCYNKKCVNLRRFCEVVFHSVPVISAIEMRVKIGFTDDCLFGRTGKTSFYRR